MRAGTVAMRVAVLFLAGCALTDPAQRSEPTDEQLQLVDEVYDRVLRSMLIRPGPLSLRLNMEYPRPFTGDLEVGVTFDWDRDFTSTTFGADVVQADGDSLHHQLLQRIVDEDRKDVGAIVGLLRTRKTHFEEAQCPALRSIYEGFRPEWMLTRPGGVLIHAFPTVIAVDVHGKGISLAASVEDEDHPLHAWALRSVREVEGCLNAPTP